MKPTFVYRFANWFSRKFMLPFYGTLEVKGAANVPLTGPLIVASNHLNDGDPGILAWGIPRRLIFMTKVELFKFPVLKQFLEAYGAFPVRRGEADLAALRSASEVLKGEGALVIYPEGTRSGLAARMRKAHSGTGLIALRSGVPVLPVAITGSQHMAMPKMFAKPFRHWRITLTIGEPFVLPKPERLNGEAAEAATEAIMAKIAALLPESYRGYYGRSENAESAPLAGDI
jgi:1-acyl-sn-glycerol-3-phosphate acyltransferase